VRAPANSKRGSLAALLIGVPLFVAMSLAFLWVAYQNYFMPKWKYQAAAWVSVDGTLDDLSIDRVVARHRTRYELLALYTYEYSGKEFTGNRIGYANEFKVDTQAEAQAVFEKISGQQPLRVWVSPHAPHRSILLKNSSGMFPVLPAYLFASCGLFLATIALYGAISSVVHLCLPARR